MEGEAVSPEIQPVAFKEEQVENPHHPTNIIISGTIDGKKIGQVTITQHKEDERNMDIFRARIEVPEESRNKGYGSQLRDSLFKRLQAIADEKQKPIIHQSAFSEKGEVFEKSYEKAGYTRRIDERSVFEKIYYPQPISA